MYALLYLERDASSYLADPGHPQPSRRFTPLPFVGASLKILFAETIAELQGTRNEVARYFYDIMII